MNHPPTKNLKGFTLVELIVVIIVVAIMAVYASSRFIGVSRFSAHAAQQQGIAVIRQIQLGRMQSNIADEDNLHQRHSLLVTDKCLGSVQACTTSGSEPLSNKVVIHEQEMKFSPPLTIGFDLLGNPSCQSGCSTPNDAEVITIQVASDAEQANICINSQGYVYGC